MGGDFRKSFRRFVPVYSIHDDDSVNWGATGSAPSRTCAASDDTGPLLMGERLRSVSEENARLRGLLQSFEDNCWSVFSVLTRVLEARDVETMGHSDRVRIYSLRLGRELGLDNLEMRGLEQGALLHDIGKVGVRDCVLRKGGPLDVEEIAEMRAHVPLGLRIIEKVELMPGARNVVSEHHEKFDGKGYPGALKADEIHPFARVFALIDAFDVIMSERPYKRAKTMSEARAEIETKSGTSFDPAVVDGFSHITDNEWENLRNMASNGI